MGRTPAGAAGLDSPVDVVKRAWTVEDLPPRHRRVVELVAQGWTNAQIADRLFITHNSVDRYIGEACRMFRIAHRKGNRRVLLTRIVLGVDR